MSQRPRFWIHRSRSFWGGFVILLLLCGAWIFTMFLGGETTYHKSSPTSWKFGSFRVGTGGIAVYWSERRLRPSRRSVSPPGRSFSGGTMPGATMKMEFGRYVRDWGSHSETHYNFFLPLWIPVLGWVLIWLYRMHRQDKREDMLFGSQPEGSNETATSLAEP